MHNDPARRSPTKVVGWAEAWGVPASAWQLRHYLISAISCWGLAAISVRHQMVSNLRSQPELALFDVAQLP